MGIGVTQLLQRVLRGFELVPQTSQFRLQIGVRVLEDVIFAERSVQFASPTVRVNLKLSVLILDAFQPKMEITVIC